MDLFEKGKEEIRKLILLRGNRAEYRDIIQEFSLGREVLDEILKEMNVDGDLYEPRFGQISVVV